MDETEKIKSRYASRQTGDTYRFLGPNFYFNFFMTREREMKYAEILRQHFTDPENIRLIEIGAGNGSNLYFFHHIGIPWTNLYANELLDDRFEKLKDNLPHVTLVKGNALDLDFSGYFDVVFQSTVFTSVLDDAFKKKLANKLWEMTKPGGIVLWYDFRFDNPKNKDVKGVSEKEIRSLFSMTDRIVFQPVTLAPPIGRRTGRFYNFVNTLFPFLRSHVIAVIKK